ncbi:MAG: lipoyl(octanoyl) transferase LipB, partial [Anaerolineae bacterium]
MLDVTWLGQVDYDVAWGMQKTAVSHRHTNPDLPDTLFLLEHPPTYTLGRKGKLDNLLLTETELDEQGFCLRWVDRGGDITYHGPGQLVGYPIFNLKRYFKTKGYARPDLHKYLRNLEEVLILALAAFDIHGRRYDGYTGVWVDSPCGLEKIAAIGVKVSGSGISSHGFALNVNPDLLHFENIIPCGIKEHGVTSMAVVGERPFTTTSLLHPITTAFQHV